MNPWILEQLVADRRHELERRLRRPQPAARTRHHSYRIRRLRERVGWRIVHLGLQLATAPTTHPSIGEPKLHGPEECPMVF